MGYCVSLACRVSDVGLQAWQFVEHNIYTSNGSDAPDTTGPGSLQRHYCSPPFASMENIYILIRAQILVL